VAVACWSAINKAKADASVSMGREVAHLEIVANAKTWAKLDAVIVDVLSAARCAGAARVESDSAPDGVFEIRGARFVDRKER